jgi:3-oxoacyl-[acyl-carrier protein] reductase
MAVQVDVSDEASVSFTVTRVERELGPIEVLVNDPGVMSPADTPAIWEEDPVDWWRVFEVNFLGAYLCCRSVLPGMLERRRGRIINVGSGAGYLPVAPSNVWRYVSSGSSKAALHRFGELLAGQLEKYGIAVFAISPGLVRSAMTESQSLGDDAPGPRPSSRHASSACWPPARGPPERPLHPR